LRFFVIFIREYFGGVAAVKHAHMLFFVNNLHILLQGQFVQTDPQILGGCARAYISTLNPPSLTFGSLPQAQSGYSGQAITT
jgi:hypothetical protein